jgi:hypothetical protein
MTFRVPIILAALLAGLAGCESLVVVWPDSRGPFRDAPLTDKSKWSAYGTVSNPRLAIDGDINTEARADGRHGEPEITIDLGRECLFQSVIISHGNSPDAFCRTVTVATSLDGRAYVDQYNAPGTRSVTILCMDKPVLARFVRLKATRPGIQQWALAEISLQ